MGADGGVRVLTLAAPNSRIPAYVATTGCRALRAPGAEVAERRGFWLVRIVGDEPTEHRGMDGLSLEPGHDLPYNASLVIGLRTLVRKDDHVVAGHLLAGVGVVAEVQPPVAIWPDSVEKPTGQALMQQMIVEAGDGGQRRSTVRQAGPQDGGRTGRLRAQERVEHIL